MIWLIGMMGSGKTTVGVGVAAALGVPFYDTDAMVVDMTGMTIPEIWASHGESGFRQLEKRAVSVVPSAGCVAAAGGGAVLDDDNRHVIQRAGKVAWLKCPPAELIARVGSADRPLLFDAEQPGRVLETLATQREHIYRSMATHVIDTQRNSVADATSELIELWRS